MTHEPSPHHPIALSVVLPAYNEEATIESVVRAALAVAARLAPESHEVIVVDDGSTDRTGAILDDLTGVLPALVVHHQPNRGHGPAVLAGFDRAHGRWIGHLDTDDQIPADELARLWPATDRHDLVLGVRATRHDPRHRLLVTRVLRWVVQRQAGRPIHDANVPCKLLRRNLWTELRPRIPDDTFAPSIALAVLAARQSRPIAEIEVEHQARAHGTSSLKPVRLARALLRSLIQTVRIARSVPATP